MLRAQSCNRDALRMGGDHNAIHNAGRSHPFRKNPLFSLCQNETVQLALRLARLLLIILLEMLFGA